VWKAGGAATNKETRMGLPGTMAVIKNGRQVLLRKGLPCGEPMRFVVGCSKIGASFTIVAPRKVRV